MKAPEIKRKLVFAVVQHPNIGAIIEAYIVDLNEFKEFSLTFRKVTRTTINDYNLVIPESHKDIISLIDEYSDEAIVKRFSKKQLKPLEFFNTFAKEKVELIIRPFIERRLIRIIDRFVRYNIQPYYQGRKKDAISEKPIEISSERADVVFNFIRSENGIQYYINISHEEQAISPTGKLSMVLTDTPCTLLIENKIYYFKDGIDSKKIIPFLAKPSINIQKSAEKLYFETYIKNTIKSFKVRPKGFEVIDEYPHGKTILKFDKNLNSNPVLILTYTYQGRNFLINDPDNSFVTLKQDNENYSFQKINRNRQWEGSKKQLLLDLGLINIDGAIFSIADDTVENPDEKFYKDRKFNLLCWLNEQSETLRKNNIAIVQETQNERYFVGKITINIKVNQAKDWFDIYGFVYFGEIEIPFTNLRDNIINGIREYVLPNGEIAIIPEEWFAKYSGVLLFSKKGQETLRVKKHHFALIEKLGTEETKDSQIEEFDRLRDPKKFKTYPLPKNLNATMRPYQQEGYNWLNYLRENNLNGCLADDMGLGKTLQTLAVLLKSRAEAIENRTQKIKNKTTSADQLSLFDELDIETPPHTSLIVMPLSLIHNWENEVKKFTPELKVHVHSGVKRWQSNEFFSRFDLILTTYGVIRNDILFLKDYNFHYLILDESQVIKNPGSKIFRSIKDIRSKHRLTLTGTPIENSLTDLWSQMSFLNDGLLGSLNFYRNHYVNTIEKAQDRDKQKELQQLINPFILRRTKSNVAKDLPPLTTKVYYCEMSEEQKRFYEEQKSSIRNMILENIEKQGKDKSRFVILNGLMQLRLLANHPMLVDEESNIASGKFNEILMNVNKLMRDQHKILIFSSFVKHLNLFKTYFTKKDIKFSMLTGETADKKRQDVINEFQNDPDNKIFLISIKAGGVGLNLTSADYVFILDPWWNPAVENQAINRSHRIGQNKSVFAYKFISRESIEEKILKLQQEKMHLANELVNENNPFKNFSDDEISELFN